MNNLLPFPGSEHSAIHSLYNKKMQPLREYLIKKKKILKSLNHKLSLKHLLCYIKLKQTAYTTSNIEQCMNTNNYRTKICIISQFTILCW